jgi:hypothetical protein
VLFFVISELAGVEPMYQYSLAWFVKLFDSTLQQAEKARDLQKRIDNLMSHFRYSLYLKVGGWVWVGGCACASCWHAVHIRFMHACSYPESRQTKPGIRTAFQLV